MSREEASHAESSWRRIEGQMPVRRIVPPVTLVPGDYLVDLNGPDPVFIPVDHPERERPQGSPLDAGCEED